MKQVEFRRQALPADVTHAVIYGTSPHPKPNRHRFVRLKDLVEYQAKRREQTRVVLEQMVADAEQDDLYARTDRPPPATR